MLQYIKLKKEEFICGLIGVLSIIFSYSYLFIVNPLGPDTAGTYVIGISPKSVINYQWNIACGRWVRGIVELIIQKMGYGVVVPFYIFLLLIISAFIFSIFLYRLFDFNNIVSSVFISGIFFITPAFVELFSFYHDALFHIIAIYILLLSLYFLFIKRNYLLFVLFAVILIGIYQSYFCILSSIIVLKILFDTIKNDNFNLKNSLFEFIKILFLLGFSLLISLLLGKLINILFAIDSVNQSRFNLENVNLVTMLKGLFKCYAMCITLPFKNYGGMNTTFFIKIIYFVIFILCFINLIILLKKQNIYKNIYCLILMFILPICMNCIAFLPSHTTIRMTQGLGIIFIFFAILNDFSNYKKTILILYLLIIFHFIYYANGIAYVSNIVSQGTKSFVQELVTQIRMVEGYNYTSKIFFCGNVTEKNLYDYYAFTDDNTFPIANPYNTLIYPWEFKENINRYGAFKYNEADNIEKDAIRNSVEFQEMPNFPTYGSIKKINNVIVVKFNDI